MFEVKNLKEFEEIIGYTFADKSLITEALTHSSYSNETKTSKLNCNERMEFLGDSVLSIVVSVYLFKRFKNVPEGQLTKTRASLVCEKTLFAFAKKINLGDYLLLSRGERQTGGAGRPSILSDAFEAVIAAIFLDGGIKQAEKFILSFVEEELNGKKQASAFNDYKTTLQEIVQKNPGESLEYVMVGQSGPDHNKHFEAEVHLNSNCIGQGGGRSKKEAEQAAAKKALELMGY
ncbi:MAG: ribonuclease III [Oscillospiraceae bacterium]|jgi:ribonuclease-3|nr:ribonuclease III [Oscillospiraceae bacterium]